MYFTWGESLPAVYSVCLSTNIVSCVLLVYRYIYAEIGRLATGKAIQCMKYNTQNKLSTQKKVCDKPK